MFFQQDSRKLEALAHHEAGHAVAAVVLKRGINYSTIVPRNGIVAHCAFPEPKVADRNVKTWTKREVLIGLCGPFAEARFRGEFNARGARGDFHDAENLIRGLFSQEWLDSMSLCAKIFVDTPQHWVQIEGLAAELLVHRRLGRKRIHEICRSARSADTLPRKFPHGRGDSETSRCEPGASAGSAQAFWEAYEGPRRQWQGRMTHQKRSGELIPVVSIIPVKTTPKRPAPVARSGRRPPGV